jgi:nucleoredoxin
MEAILGAQLEGKSGPVPTASIAETEFVLLYFSAHWCPPCRGFTPRLAMFYEEANSARKQVEIVFVSFDRDEAGFREYYGEMPWLTVPFANKTAREALAKRFGVSGIPQLTLLKRDGSIAVNNCRGDVETRGPAALERWRAAL